MTIATTLRTPAVWLGVGGAAMVAWGSTHNEFSFADGGWPNPVVQALGALVPLPINRLLIVVGAIALTWAWWHVKPTRERPPVHAGLTLTLWSLPLLLAPPVLSNDAVLYADLGWIRHLGYDPYVIGLTAAGGPFAPQVDPLWAGFGVAYPPPAILVNQAVVVATGMHPYFSVVAMRIPVLVSIAADAATRTFTAGVSGFSYEDLRDVAQLPRLMDAFDDFARAQLDPALWQRFVAYRQHGGEGSNAGVDVNGGAAGEVERAALAEPASEHPLEHRHVDQQRPHRHEDGPRRELHPVGHGTTDERRRDGSEHPEEGNGRELPSVVVDADAGEHRKVERAEEVVLERLRRQRVAHQHPQHRDHQHAVEVHHQHVEHVASAVHAAVEERKTGNHEQDECC